MGLIGFLMGLGCGLLLLLWHRAHSNQKIKTLLSDLRPEAALSPFSAASQISLAIAYQQQIQQRLERQLETYRQLLQVAPIGFLWVDEENQLLWCNPEARQLLRMPQADDQEPRLLLELVRSYELDVLIEEIRTSQAPGKRDWVFYPYNPDPTRLAKQQSYALRGHGFPLEQNTIGIFIESRQEAVTLVQQRDRWASDVAHELKTPLTSIRLIAETLQTRLEGSLHGWTERLINQTIRLSDLVQDLLELGKLEQGAFEGLNLSTVDLVDLVHNSWNTLEPLSRKKNLTLAYEGPEQLILQLDEVRFYRVLVNLFDNGIKFSPPWGVIQAQISLESSSTPREMSLSNQVLCLKIVDMGLGFSKEDLPYVFERFYRADSARTREVESANLDEDKPGTESGRSPFRMLDTRSGDRPQAQSSTPAQPQSLSQDTQRNKNNSQGSGLGLSIVQQIVEAHQGTVTATNHPETGGACLQIRLPRYADSPNSHS
ncbi:MAG: PAS domain-containing sensor histidine kinase [Cyanobacteria bacterium P01_A01_bin.37]